MDATEYTHRLRRVATWSWLGALALVLLLAGLGLLPLHPGLPFLALALGLVPILLFVSRTRPTCPDCGGRLRVAVGFPRIVYRCPRCGREVATGIHADY
ncbi:hypothetical protein FJ251_09415 [bacterium]|nr:hypothetical protein [bacterium]